MRTRTLVIVLVLAAVFFTVTLAMRGDGRGLAKWMASIHGR
jgi:hypothetical protein